MTKTGINRRTLLVSGAAVAGARFLPRVASPAKARWIVSIVYDKALGGMRLVEKLVR